MASGFTRELPPQYRLLPFAGQDEVAGEDVLDLWEREGALRRERGVERLHEVLVVAVHEDAGLVGVNSVYLRRNEQLGMTMWHSRVFVAADHRFGNLAANVASAGRDHLSRRFTSGEDRRAQGMIFEVENEALRRAKNLAFWRQTDFGFIGERPDGAHVRVFYFPGALAPDPPR